MVYRAEARRKWTWIRAEGLRLRYEALLVGEGADVLGCVVSERFGEISWVDGGVYSQ